MKSTDQSGRARFKRYVQYWMEHEPESVSIFLAANIGLLVDRVTKLEHQVRGLKARKRK